MKKMIRNVCVAAMTALLAFTTLTGCGGQDAQSGGQNEGSGTQASGQNEESGAAGGEQTGVVEDSQTADGEWTGEVEKVVMTFLTGGVEPADLGMVQDAINEITTKKIGVEIEFRPVSIFEAPATVPMWIGGGEQIDLFCAAFTGVDPFISLNMIEPMTDLLAQNAPYLEEFSQESPLYYEKNGDVYGVRVTTNSGRVTGGYLFFKEDLEAAGFEYKDGDQITLDDLDVIFAKLKELYPDSYPAGLFGSTSRAGMTMVYDTLGATASSGALIGLDSTEVVNYYASEEYKSFLEHARGWYEKGYVLQDAATTDISLNESMTSGLLRGYFNEYDPFLRETANITYGKEVLTLVLVEPYAPSVAPALNEYWTIPVTAAHPEAAVRLLNLAFSDSEVDNLFAYGIEGVHYEKTGENTIQQTERTTSSYAIPGQMGITQHRYYVSVDTSAEDEALDALAQSRRTKGYGFFYDATAMTTQITAIDAVVAKYQAALETGSVDLETEYPKFLQELEAAGINEVIADKQAQFDAWLNQQ